MRRLAAFFVCALAIIGALPFEAHADEVESDPPPAFTSFALNGEAHGAVISSTTPSVDIEVNAPEEAYFTRLYICPEDAEPCNQGSATKFFSPNATTTAFSRTWDGEMSGGGFAPAGEYHIVVRFFRYTLSPDAFEESAPFFITILEEEEDDADDEDEEEESDDDEDDESDNAPPGFPGGDFVCCFIDSDLSVTIGGTTFEGPEGVFDFFETFPPPAAIAGDAIENPSTTLTVTFRERENPDVPGQIRTVFDAPVPAERGVYVLHRIVSDPTPENGPEGDTIFPGVNFSMVHAPIPANDGDPDTIESATITFPDLPPAFGDPSAPSGEYHISVFEYPETKFVSNLDTDAFTEEPYTDADFLHYYEWQFVDYDFFEGNTPEYANYSPENEAAFTIAYTAASGPVYQECCSSVVFLPGIKGSVLKTGSDTLWPPSIGNIPDFTEDILQLALDPITGESVNIVTVDGILNNFYSTQIYSGFSSFMDTLTGIDLETGTSTIKAWEPFAYDWRFSPEKIVADGDMILRLEALAEDSDTGQITIVAHSMGGLVGKELIRQLEANGKGSLIDAFVMVGSPQLGTPQAIASLLHGDDEGIAGGLIVDASHIRTVAQYMPSAYLLLPSMEYFARVADASVIFNENASFTKPWRDFWGSSLNQYLNFFSFVTGGGVAREKPSATTLRIPAVLNPDLLVAANATHTTLDSYEFPDFVRVVQVAGWGIPTTKAIEYKTKHLVQNYQLVPTREGDKTVVYPSAISNVAQNLFFNLDSFNNLPDAPDFQHRDLLSAPPIQTLLQSVFEGKSIEESEFITSSKPSVLNLDDQILVRTNSPVILGVYDEFGNFTGIDPSQDLNSAVLFITEDIPGSSFLLSGDSQSLFLPEGGVYTFIYQGTDDGETTVEIGVFSNDQEAITQTFTDILTTASTTASFSISLSGETTIEIDHDSDGTTDEMILSDEAQVAQETDEPESEPTTSTSPVSSGGGGGPIWNTFSASTIPPRKDAEGTTTTPAVIQSAGSAVATADEEIRQISETLASQSIQGKEQISTLDKEMLSPPLTTTSGQTATAIQSGWYDIFINFIQDTLASFKEFIRGFF